MNTRMILPLSKLSIGENAFVKQISCENGIKNRLLDLGLIEDTKVSVWLKSPSGNPTAYYIRGTVIALRDSEAEKIFVNKDIKK